MISKGSALQREAWSLVPTQKLRRTQSQAQGLSHSLTQCIQCDFTSKHVTITRPLISDVSVRFSYSNEWTRWPVSGRLQAKYKYGSGALENLQQQNIIILHQIF